MPSRRPAETTYLIDAETGEELCRASDPRAAEWAQSVFDRPVLVSFEWRRRMERIAALVSKPAPAPPPRQSVAAELVAEAAVRRRVRPSAYMTESDAERLNFLTARETGHR